MKLAYYLVPMFVFTSISISHFINTSFGVYLKYQALVDTYHKQETDARYAELGKEDSDEETKRKRELQ